MRVAALRCDAANLRSTWIFAIAVLNLPLVSWRAKGARARARVVLCFSCQRQLGLRHKGLPHPDRRSGRMGGWEEGEQGGARQGRAAGAARQCGACSKCTSKSFSFELMSSVAALSSPSAPSTRGSRSSPSPTTFAGTVCSSRPNKTTAAPHAPATARQIGRRARR